MDAALADAEAVVYTAAFDPETVDEQTLLDEAARGVYVALTAAVEVGVRRMVLVSRLDLVRDYPEEYVVNAQWNPLPRAEAVSLAPMMAEMMRWRLFARRWSRSSPDTVGHWLTWLQVGVLLEGGDNGNREFRQCGIVRRGRSGRRVDDYITQGQLYAAGDGFAANGGGGGLAAAERTRTDSRSLGRAARE